MTIWQKTCGRGPNKNRSTQASLKHPEQNIQNCLPKTERSKEIKIKRGTTLPKPFQLPISLLNQDIHFHVCWQCTCTKATWADWAKSTNSAPSAHHHGALQVLEAHQKTYQSPSAMKPKPDAHHLLCETPTVPQYGPHRHKKSVSILAAPQLASSLWLFKEDCH